MYPMQNYNSPLSGDDFAQAFEQSGASMIITDADLEGPGPRILAVNRSFGALTGYSAAEVLGRSPRILQGPLSDRAVLARLKVELRAGRAFHGETVNYRKDGSTYVVEWTVDPMRDETGKVVRFVAVQRDVTAQRRLAEHVRRTAEFLRHLLDALPDHAVVALDPEGLVTGWTAQAARIQGYADTEILGRHHSLLHPPEDIAAGLPERNLQRARAGLPCEQEGWRLRRDGSRFWAQVNLAALRDCDGRLLGYVKIIRDRSAHREALAERTRLEDELHHLQRMESLGILAGGVAHDFNNILAAILAQAEAWHLLPRLAPASIEHIRLACAKARALTQRLHSLSRPDGRRITRLDLTALTGDVLRLLRPSIPVNIELDYEPSFGPILVEGDPAEWTQLVMNLCVNARDALADRPGRITVRIHPSHSLPATLRPATLAAHESYVLEVADDGPGIPDEIMPRLFERFFSTKPPGQGTGLGLPIVQNVARRWGGTVTVTSRPGHGATFRVFLPFPSSLAAAA